MRFESTESQDPRDLPCDIMRPMRLFAIKSRDPGPGTQDAPTVSFLEEVQMRHRTQPASEHAQHSAIGLLAARSRNTHDTGILQLHMT